MPSHAARTRSAATSARSPGWAPATGVIVEPDARRALDRGADIAVVSVSSYLSVMADHFRLCLEGGANVVTIEEETVWPWGTAPELAAELDGIAKQSGVTLAASGAQDVFWLHLVGTLLGAAHRVDTVEGRCSVERRRLRAGGGG